MNCAHWRSQSSTRDLNHMKQLVWSMINCLDLCVCKFGKDNSKCFFAKTPKAAIFEVLMMVMNRSLYNALTLALLKDVSWISDKKALKDVSVNHCSRAQEIWDIKVYLSYITRTYTKQHYHLQLFSYIWRHHAQSCTAPSWGTISS